jgi:hypothetical protein
VKQVLAHLNAELRCVLRFDVTSFNETVKQVELLHLLKEGVRKLPGWTEEDTILFVQLLQDYFRRVSEALKTPGVGIGMGSPLTPFFTNIYLDQLDRFLQGRGVPFVRYGDDISAFFHTPGEAAEMKDRVRGFINECLGQKIKDEKTVIACLDISETGADMPQGFDFCAFHYFVTASEAVDVRIKNKTLQKVRRSIRYFTVVGDDAEAQPVPFRGIQLDGRTWTAIIDIGLRLGFPERKTSPMEPIPDHMLTRFSGQGWPNAFLKEARSEAMKLQFRELDRYIRYRLQRIERRLGGETSKESEFYHRMRRFGLRSFMDAWNRQPKLSEA